MLLYCEYLTTATRRKVSSIIIHRFEIHVAKCLFSALNMAIVVQTMLTFRSSRLFKSNHVSLKMILAPDSLPKGGNRSPSFYSTKHRTSEGPLFSTEAMRKQTDASTYTIGIIAPMATVSEFCLKYVERNTSMVNRARTGSVQANRVCDRLRNECRVAVFFLLLLASRLIYKQK